MGLWRKLAELEDYMILHRNNFVFILYIIITSFLIFNVFYFFMFVIRILIIN